MQIDHEGASSPSINARWHRSSRAMCLVRTLSAAPCKCLTTQTAQKTSSRCNRNSSDAATTLPSLSPHQKTTGILWLWHQRTSVRVGSAGWRSTPSQLSKAVLVYSSPSASRTVVWPPKSPRRKNQHNRHKKPNNRAQQSRIRGSLWFLRTI